MMNSFEVPPAASLTSQHSLPGGVPSSAATAASISAAAAASTAALMHLKRADPLAQFDTTSGLQNGRNGSSNSSGATSGTHTPNQILSPSSVAAASERLMMQNQQQRSNSSDLQSNPWSSSHTTHPGAGPSHPHPHHPHPYDLDVYSPAGSLAHSQGGHFPGPQNGSSPYASAYYSASTVTGSESTSSAAAAAAAMAVASASRPQKPSGPGSGSGFWGQGYSDNGINGQHQSDPLMSLPYAGLWPNLGYHASYHAAAHKAPRPESYLGPDPATQLADHHHHHHHRFDASAAYAAHHNAAMRMSAASDQSCGTNGSASVGSSWTQPSLTSNGLPATPGSSGSSGIGSNLNAGSSSSSTTSALLPISGNGSNSKLTLLLLT